MRSSTVWGWIINTEREVLFFLNFSDYIYSIGKSHRKEAGEKNSNYWRWALLLIALPSALLEASKQLRGYLAPVRRKGSAELHSQTVILACWRGGSCPCSLLTHLLPQAPHLVACPGLTSAQSCVTIQNTQKIIMGHAYLRGEKRLSMRSGEWTTKHAIKNPQRALAAKN